MLAFCSVNLLESAAAADGELIRPTHVHHGIVALEMNANFEEPKSPSMRVINDEAAYDAFRKRIPAHGPSKFDPPPKNRDRLRLNRLHDLKRSTVVVVETNSMDTPVCWSVVEDPGGRKTISISFPDSLSARPLGTGSYLLLAFPKFKGAVDMKKIEHPSAQKLAEFREETQILAKAARELPRTGTIPAAEIDAKTVEIAKRHARSQHPGRTAWQLLLAARVLSDPMKLEDAVRLLGRPTHRSENSKQAKMVDWYFNPEGRHVAPCLRASQREDSKLVGWTIIHR